MKFLLKGRGERRKWLILKVNYELNILVEISSSKKQLNGNVFTYTLIDLRAIGD